MGSSGDARSIKARNSLEQGEKTSTGHKSLEEEDLRNITNMYL